MQLNCHTCVAARTPATSIQPRTCSTAKRERERKREREQPPHLHVSSSRTMARTMVPSITSVSPQMSLKGVPRAHSYTTCGAEGLIGSAWQGEGCVEERAARHLWYRKKP